MLWSRAGLTLLGISCLSLGCSMKAGEEVRLIGVSSMTNPTPAKASLPATYQGVLPCADCPGIRTTLNMWPDGVFYLRRTYLGKGDQEKESSLYEVGQWKVIPDGTKLELQEARDSLLSFAVKSATHLRPLDSEGREIASRQEVDLVRQPRFDWFEPRLILDGMYATDSGARRFKECLTGRPFSVAQEAEVRALDAAYAKGRMNPGEPLLATVEARIARPHRHDSGEQHRIVVERFIELWPGETCGQGLVAARLDNTYWKVVRLAGRPVPRPAGGQEIHMRLISDGRKVQGFAGCNRFLGSYELEDNRIRFIGLATTRMACADSMEAEKEFLNALSEAGTWKILGNHLELYGSDGKVLGRFESLSPNRP